MGAYPCTYIKKKSWSVLLPTTRTHAPYAFDRGKPESEIWKLYKGNSGQVKRTLEAIYLVQEFIPLEIIYNFSWVEAELSEDHNRPIFVDVGGSKGHAVRAILIEKPFLPPDRVTLQDRRGH
ncbi:hypothetical protein LZ30DRAFT_719863 [Colletotrichum cereale]|nr:hypothetical protein LZ30DRAFT_719863 [Colletotrichum cereale]